jgi:hypothetical protein
MATISNVSIARIDDIVIEGKSPVLEPKEYLRMIAEDLNRPIEQVWRVRFYDDGTVALFSFALPAQEKNLVNRQRLNSRSQLPNWIVERIAVLQICQAGDSIDGVGQKVSESAYYVIE